MTSKGTLNTGVFPGLAMAAWHPHLFSAQANKAAHNP
jgi:hypothetical protein